MRKRPLYVTNEEDAEQKHDSKRRRLDNPDKVKLFAQKNFYDTLNDALRKEQPVEIVDKEHFKFTYINIDSLRGWELLCNAIATNQSIEVVEFDYAKQLTKDVLQLIFDGLILNSYIKEVSLFERLPDIHVEWWSKLVRSTVSLEYLRIPASTWTPDACKSFSEALAVNNSLRRLTVYGNGVGAEGCKWISETLKVNKTLESLNLTVCGIDDKGCTYLSDALKVNRALIALNLDTNKFANAGLASLCNALKTNTTLDTLCLNDNRIGTEGCKLVVDLLKTNTTLTYLSLMGNDITDEDCHYLAEAIKVTKSLSHLLIGFNKFREKGLDIIGDALEVNRSLTHVDTETYDIKKSNVRMQRIYTLMLNNREYLKSNMMERMVVALVSIAKRPESYRLFPKEIWIAIFARITYPGLGSFGNIATKIFNDVNSIRFNNSKHVYRQIKSFKV